MKENTLSMSETERYLMYQVAKMLKDKLLLPITFIKVPTRDGRSFILTKWTNNQPQDLTRNSDYTSVDHSILSQDYQ
jgi:hypothetical protein